MKITYYTAHVLKTVYETKYMHDYIGVLLTVHVHIPTRPVMPTNNPIYEENLTYPTANLLIIQCKCLSVMFLSLKRAISYQNERKKHLVD